MPNLLNRFGGLLSSSWKVVTFLREIFLNILFLLFIILLISVLLYDRGKQLPDEAALLLNLHGNVVEQKSASMLPSHLFSESSSEETLLRDIIHVIDFAKDDQRIKLMVLDLREMGSAGISKLREIGAALKRFRAGGKEIIVFGDYFDQRQYYLAAHADKVYLSPMGGVVLTGLGLYRTYMKSALEKLKINMHIFVVGSYKSALEPFFRDDMSDYAREANLAWLNTLWQSYTSDVANQRGLNPPVIDAFINNLSANLAEVDGDTAELALQHGLVDALKNRDEVLAELSDLVGKSDDEQMYRHIQFEDYLQHIRPKLDKSGPQKGQVAVIVAKGMVLDGEQPAGRIGGDTLANLIREARQDDEIQSVVLRIDSGGGSALASEVIRREVELTSRSGKPMVVSMGSVAASGGYWMAVSADEIWASPTTITGSIGIFGAFPTFEESLAALGIHNDGIGTTEMADAFNPERSLKPMVADSIRLIIENGYRQFLERVAQGRGMKLEKVKKIAEGRVWTGEAALEFGLVDKLGSFSEAIQAAAARAGLDDYKVQYIQRPLSAREKLIQRLNRLILSLKGDAIGPDLQRYRRLGAEYRQLMLLNDPFGVYAYCLNCSPE